MKFKRINIIQLARQHNLDYTYFDILRQTTIERIVNNPPLNMTKQELINLLLCNTKNYLNYCKQSRIILRKHHTNDQYYKQSSMTPTAHNLSATAFRYTILHNILTSWMHYLSQRKTPDRLIQHQ